MRVLASLLLLVACKSSAPAPKPAPPPPPPAEASFSGLFRAGASWRFKVTREITDYSEEEDRMVTRTSTSELGCGVTATRTFPGGRASEIECDEGADWRVTERIAGVWIQTPEGLWRHDELPDEGVAPTLDLADRFLPADPRPVHEETRDPEDPEGRGPAFGSGSTLEIEGSGEDWCVFTSSWGGDESWNKLCLAADGPFSGGTGFAGAATDDLTFERITPDAP